VLGLGLAYALFICHVSPVCYRMQQKVTLPEPGKYATGILFVDKDAKNAAAVENMFEQLAQQVNLQVGNHLHVTCIVCCT